MQDAIASRDPVIAFIALGANLGDAVRSVLDAVTHLAALPHTQLLACSSLYRSAPIDSSGPDYINAVMKISTKYPGYSLLGLLQQIEHSADRKRPYRNAPRTLDLDLLLYGDAQIESDVLTVPHPRMWKRAFVLRPLREIAPEKVSDAQLAAVQYQATTQLDA